MGHSSAIKYWGCRTNSCTILFSTRGRARTTSISPSEAITAQVVAGNRSAACEIDPCQINKHRLPLPKQIFNHIFQRRCADDCNTESSLLQRDVMMATREKRILRASRAAGVTLKYQLSPCSVSGPTRLALSQIVHIFPYIY